MTGERWEWFRVASHLKIPVDELKARMTYHEFVDWLTYLNKVQPEAELKQEYGLAIIAAEIRRTLVKNPERVRPKDFLVRFITDADRARMEQSKAAWMWACGFKPDGSPREINNN